MLRMALCQQMLEAELYSSHLNPDRLMPEKRFSLVSMLNQALSGLSNKGQVVVTGKRANRGAGYIDWKFHTHILFTMTETHQSLVELKILDTISLFEDCNGLISCNQIVIVIYP